MANNLRESIAIACETQVSLIRREISERSIALELAYRRIELTDGLIQSWESRIAQLERLAELGDSRPADLVAAESALLATELSRLNVDSKRNSPKSRFQSPAVDSACAAAADKLG